LIGGNEVKSVDLLKELGTSGIEIDRTVSILKGVADWYAIQNPPGRREARDLVLAIPHLEALFLDVPEEDEPVESGQR